jgi:hypothetical protein
MSVRASTLSPQLFRRRVGQRAHDQSRTGQAGDARDRGDRETGRLGHAQLREAEVQQLHTRAGQHDVGWLQVAMHDSLAVGRDQCVGNIDGVGERLFHRKWPACDSRRQRLAIEQLHDQIRHVRSGDLGNADVVHGADAWMRQPGDRACLAFEPLAAAWRGIAL